MKKTIARMLSLTLLLSLGLSACGGNGEESSVASEGQENTPVQLETIIITEPARGYLWAPVYLAQTLGYFAEAGLTADFQTISGGDPGAPVFAGEAQFGFRGVEMPMAATDKGQGCKILVSTTARFPYIIMGQGEDNATLEQLRGKAVNGGSPSGSPMAWVKACLNYAGLDAETDVDLLTLGSTGVIAAMNKGDIQACVATNPWTVKQLEANGAVKIVDGTDDETFKKIVGSETYEMFIMFASDEYIAKEPETVQKVVTAVTKALKWMKDKSAEEIATQLKPLFPDRDEEVLYSVQNALDTGLYNFEGYHTESGYAAAVKMAKLASMTEKEITAEQIYDESFLDKAWAEIGK